MREILNNMSNETNLESLEVQPTVETLEPVVEQPKEIVYEYQPTDETGRPLGAKQVFKGFSEKEVLDKVAKAHQESIKLNRELNKKIRLGNLEEDVLPSNVTRFNQEEVEFKQITLTPEEKAQIARDLLDPDKFEEASSKLIEFSLGAKPQQVRNVLAEAKQDISTLRAEKEATLFVQSNTDYFACKENFETLANWMLRYNLAPVKENFQLAYDTLKAAGLLLEAPIVREESTATPVVVETPVNPQPESEETSRITSNQPSQEKRNTKIASGLTKSITSNVGTSSRSNKLSVEEIEKMPADEYKKRLLKDPNFSKEVNEAYAAIGK